MQPHATSWACAAIIDEGPVIDRVLVTADDAEPFLIDRRRTQDAIDAGQDVAQIALAEILDVGARERLALAVTAARIEEEFKIAVSRDCVPQT
jgi:hypothetical protein